jgi:hypothetical protein
MELGYWRLVVTRNSLSTQMLADKDFGPMLPKSRKKARISASPLGALTVYYEGRSRWTTAAVPFKECQAWIAGMY